MNIDMPVDKLIDYLPHRPPMIWVNRVTEVGKDYKGLVGKCIVDLDKSSLYISEENFLRGSAAIEFTAQGFGYLKAAYQSINNINSPPTKTYLTGVRSCRANFSTVDLDVVTQLEVRLKVLRSIQLIAYVRGEIFVPDSQQLVAEAEIQVYFD